MKITNPENLPHNYKQNIRDLMAYRADPSAVDFDRRIKLEKAKIKPEFDVYGIAGKLRNRK
jgi:hypothetical protein